MGLVGIIAAVMVGVTMIAFVRIRPGAPIETASPPSANTSASPAVTISPAAATAGDSIPAPTWSGTRRASRLSDGSKTIAFHLAATRDVPVWMNQARPVLAARCVQHTIEVFVMLDTSASFEHDADRRTVRIQWDEEPSSVQQWGVSESAKELFAPDGKALVERMATAHRLRFGFTPHNAEPVTADFAVQGFDQLAGLVTSTCK